MKTYGLIGLIIAAGLAAQAKDCSVDVYVAGAAAMPAGMLLNARLGAAAIFAEIAVPIRIRMGIPAHDRNNSCGAPILIRMEDTSENSFHSGALAYALPYKESGTCIHVFLDRILLNRRRPSANTVLAHVMVHEITHVLQGIDRHSTEGVMKARWAEADFVSMENHKLRFATNDVMLIRLGLAERVTPQSALNFGVPPPSDHAAVH